MNGQLAGQSGRLAAATTTTAPPSSNQLGRAVQEVNSAYPEPEGRENN